MSREYSLYDPANDPLAVPRNSKDVQTILDTVAHESDQIDAICETRGWWHIDHKLRADLDAYLAGTVSLGDTSERLATPIEEAYTSADQGRAFWDAELTARAARLMYEPEEADVAEMTWGQPVTMCEPGPSVINYDSTEGQLWRLYFSIIHASRKVPWQGESSKKPNLVELVRALKQRHDPPHPDDITPALRNDWLWSSGKLWSNLIMLGPSARETWNDQPVGTMGFTVPEIHAWENQNAFIAFLAAEGIMDLTAYGVGAFQSALEGGITSDNRLPMTGKIKAQRMQVTLGIIVIWLQIAGEAIYAQVPRREEASALEEVPTDTFDASELRWGEINSHRWRFWKEQLETIAQGNDLDDVARNHAATAVDRMRELEETISQEDA